MIGRRQRWLGGAVVVAILAATLVAVLAGVRHERSSADDERSRLAEAAMFALAAEVGASTAALENLRGFFEASDDVTRADFRRFTASSLERQRALEYIAWTPLGDGDGLAEGRGGPGARARLDDPMARDARTAARDSAMTRMTPPLPGEPAPTTLLVAPVYSAGAPLSTVAERRAALRGHVSALSRFEALAATAGRGLPEGARLWVRDGGARLTGDEEPGPEPEGTVEVAGREWVMGLTGVAGPSPTLPVGVGLAGVLLAFVVGLLFRSSSERERVARSELEGLRVRHDLILDAADDGIVGLDRDVRATFVNGAAARMLGWEVDDLTGGRFDELVLPAVGAPVRAGRAVGGEGPVRRRDRTVFTGEYTATPIVSGAQTTGSVVVVRDISRRKEQEQRDRDNLAAAEELAAIDALTGLANHRTFHDRLRVELQRAERHGRGLALVLLDLDNFKQVNDRFGHQAGDRVLSHAARIFEQETRTGELVARVGGEEFAMILPEADGDEAVRAAERVRKAIAAARFPEVGRMTMSAGVSDLTQARDAETLYRLADGALYWAKHSGRDMVLRHAPNAPRTRPAPPVVAAAPDDRRQALVSVRLLARVVDAKDPSTRRHSERVAGLSAELAEALGWDPLRVAALREAALVHDVGKIGVPEELLSAARVLTAAEMQQMREHADVGSRILREALTLEQVAWVRGHHERWDGKGYPDGLTAEECPEGARIIALAEAWDVMTTDRPYSPMPRTPAQAIAECRAQAGSQFWPPAVEALARLRGGG